MPAEGISIDEGTGGLLFNRRPPPRPIKRKFPEAYPDYNKSLVSQKRGDPETAGLMRGAGYGTIGAVLAVLGAKMIGLGGAGQSAAGMAGGGIGFMQGYSSGKDERTSENTRLNFLKRLGVNSPGDMEALSKYDLSGRALERGEKI